jgi:hypothetical protein
MKSVWLLHHAHEFEDGHEDVKLIGVLANDPESGLTTAEAVRIFGRKNPRSLSCAF